MSPSDVDGRVVRHRLAARLDRAVPALVSRALAAPGFAGVLFHGDAVEATVPTYRGLERAW